MNIYLHYTDMDIYSGMTGSKILFALKRLNISQLCAAFSHKFTQIKCYIYLLLNRGRELSPYILSCDVNPRDRVPLQQLSVFDDLKTGSGDVCVELKVSSSAASRAQRREIASFYRRNLQYSYVVMSVSARYGIYSDMSISTYI